VHLGPDLVRADAHAVEQDDEVVEQIRGLGDHRLPVAADGIERHLHGLLGELLPGFGDAGIEQPCGAGCEARIGADPSKIGLELADAIGEQRLVRGQEQVPPTGR
jgi:hypothetical protein